MSRQGISQVARVQLVGDEDCGLQLLKEAEGEAKLDIIAIHGIGAHPFRTWQSMPTHTNWLTDKNMLPFIAPNARILSYGYKSQWFGQDRVQSNLVRIAELFLVDLKRERERTGERPMVFIAHCFGGLVLAQALIDARNHAKEWPGIYDFTTGIAFFGTPFRGAEGMKPTQMLELAMHNYSEGEIDGSVLHTLSPDNELLQKLVDDFARVRQHQIKTRIACFFESAPTDIGLIFGGKKQKFEYAVSERSGCLEISETTKKFNLQRNHFQITKFSSEKERDLQVVLDAVRWMVDGAPALVDARREYNETMSSLILLSPNRTSQITRLKELHDFGTTYQKSNKLDEAETKYKIAIEGYQRLGFEGREVLTAYYNLGTVYWKRGNFDDAEGMMEKAVHGARLLAPHELLLPDSLHNLAIIYRSQRKLDHAKELFNQALDQYTKILPPSDRAVLKAQRNLEQLKRELEYWGSVDIDPMDLDP